MRFQVPQFVDIEDKVVGPFTLKQFFIYLGTALLLVPVGIFADISLFLTAAVPSLGVAAAFAHAKIYGQTLFQTIINMFSFAQKGSLFTWQRVAGTSDFKVTGDEYQQVTAQSLQNQARALATGGKLVDEDLEDPYAE